MKQVKDCGSAQELIEQHIYPLMTNDNYGILDRVIKATHAFLLVKKDGKTSLKLVRYSRAGTTWRYEIQEEQEITMSVSCPAKLLNRSENKHPKAVSWRKKAKVNLVS